MVDSKDARDCTIDFLRSLSIALIVLAHTPNISDTIKNFRVFDVPLITILLGSSYIISSSRNSDSYFIYIKKRFKRLVIPTWKFLSLYFILWSIIYFIFGKPHFLFKDILGSFLLYDGIGFVWIIRVFFLIAILSPFIKRIAIWATTSTSRILIVTILFYLLYYILIYIYEYTGLGLFYESMVLETIGYSFFALIGMIVYLNKNHGKKFFLFVGIITFLISGIKNGFPAFQFYKYPPMPYYLGYSLMVSMILSIFFNSKKILLTKKIEKSQWVRFISAESMNIYYVHILFLPVVNNLPIKNGILIYFILFIGSILTIKIAFMINQSFKFNSD